MKRAIDHRLSENRGNGRGRPRTNCMLQGCTKALGRHGDICDTCAHVIYKADDWRTLQRAGLLKVARAEYAREHFVRA